MFESKSLRMVWLDTATKISMTSATLFSSFYLSRKHFTFSFSMFLFNNTTKMLACCKSLILFFTSMTQKLKKSTISREVSKYFWHVCYTTTFYTKFWTSSPSNAEKVWSSICQINPFAPSVSWRKQKQCFKKMSFTVT